MEHITKRLEQISFKKSFTKKYPNNDFGPNRKITIYILFNDECKNGLNSFVITGEIYKPGNGDVDCCGCIHDDIKQHFPEFAKYIPYHLVSSDGPLYYIANTVYHAESGDLEAARSTAIWPEGTLEQLKNPTILRARLPEVMLQFERLMIELSEM